MLAVQSNCQHKFFKHLEYIMKDKNASKAIHQIEKDGHNTEQVCNYDNNYYGDQVCILAKKAGK